MTSARRHGDAQWWASTYARIINSSSLKDEGRPILLEAPARSTIGSDRAGGRPLLSIHCCCAGARGGNGMATGRHGCRRAASGLHASMMRRCASWSLASRDAGVVRVSVCRVRVHDAPTYIRTVRGALPSATVSPAPSSTHRHQGASNRSTAPARIGIPSPGMPRQRRLILHPTAGILNSTQLQPLKLLTCLCASWCAFRAPFLPIKTFNETSIRTTVPWPIAGRCWIERCCSVLLFT